MDIMMKKKIENEQQLTKELESTLKLPVNAPVVSEESNRIVIDFIRQHAATIRAKQQTIIMPWLVKIAAMFAISAIAIFAIFYNSSDPQTAKPTVAKIANDLNADGTINIIDVYMMAKQSPQDKEKIHQLLKQSVSLEGKI